LFHEPIGQRKKKKETTFGSVFFLLFITMLPDGIRQIYSVTNKYCLLDNSLPKLIGRTYHSKRYLTDGSVSLQDVIEFNFGDKNNPDIFFFEDGLLVYSSISLHREAFMLDCYQELIQSKKVSPVAFISLVTERYTLTMMGFLD
jgi:hypothetical protein